MAIRVRHLFFLFIFFTLLPFAMAEGTRTWEQSKADDLSKGTARGVAIRSEGGLELAPSFKAVTTTPSTYIWAIACDHAGNLYAATGAPARIYQITPDGKSVAIFEPQELQVQSLVVDAKGDIYAATNPDGKIYRIERPKTDESGKDSTVKASGGKWTSSVFFDSGTKYIWDLLLDPAGNLYVATGDHGEIFRVTPQGEHSLFFKSDEEHIRTLALDKNGNVIAGSDGSGLIYRISPSGEAFVLYSAPKKEITALAVDREGNIYAAGTGEKTASTFATPPMISLPRNSSVQVSTGQKGTVTISTPSGGASAALGNFPASGASAGGSEIYRIATDGSPMSLWSSREDLVYALTFDKQGHLLAGTGNRGHIFAIASEDDFTDLLQASASQITAFAHAPNGGIYAATSNLGKIFLLGASPNSEGTYESDVYDAHIFSRWGRLEYRGAGNVELFARSGNVDNPDRNWSPWKKVDMQKDSVITSPSARFIQWKAVLHAGDPSPKLDEVTVNYLTKNVAPDFDEVTAQVGVRYQAVPRQPGNEGDAMSRADIPPQVIRDRDSIGLRWSVHDGNDDNMVYSVYYKGDGEGRWLLLKDNLSEKFYSFDASLLPDGGYTVKVIASDAPSHSPGEALTAEKESARFEVDTTPPRIENLSAAMENGKIHVSFRGSDGFSNIRRAEYSIDATDWQYIDPVDKISDSKQENYDFSVAIPAGSDNSVDGKSTSAANAEHVVVVRVYDQYQNMSSAKAVIHGK